MSIEITDRQALYGSTHPPAEQRRAFLEGKVPVVVYGLGKMGLPLAAVYADACGAVEGVDVDPDVVEAVNAGKCHVAREPGLSELVADLVEREALSATDDPVAAAERGRVHVVIVPTLLTDDRQPDLSMVEAVVDDVAQGLERGDLVIVESTVPPRTCEDVVLPRLEAGSGLDRGSFGVAFCPERTLSGQALADIRGTHPKVVGGVDAESTRAAELVYGELTSNTVIPVADATTAEAVKVFEGVYRDVNIAIANELALYARVLGIDVTEAIDVANTQPFCDIHRPGPGVGGHCIPVYPYFLAGQFDVDAALMRAARARNDSMPAHTVDLIEAGLDLEGVPLADASVLLLGVTYKGNVAEVRNAPAAPIAERLIAAGATVAAVDPLIADWEGPQAVSRVALTDLDPGVYDAAVLLAAHDEFGRLDWDAFEDAVIVDGSHVIDADSTERPVYTVGGRWP